MVALSVYASVVPHQLVDIKDTVPLAVITRIAKTSPLELREEIRTAFPAVVVAASGIQSVWSVIFTVASVSKSIVVSVSSRDNVIFQPVELLVFMLRVLVANTGDPGVMFGNILVETTNVRDAAAAVVICGITV